MKKWFLSLLILSTISLTLAPSCKAQEVSSDNVESAKSKIEKMKSQPIRDKWALIVGISKFKNKNIPKLQFAAKDAADFYRYLIQEANFRKDHVRILLNEEATERRILSNLCEDFLPNLVQPNDLVVVYFSTHGSPSQVNLRGEGKNYLVAYDSNPKKLLTTGIEMREMLKTIGGQVNSKRILLVLDACHSGTIDPNAKGLKRIANFDTAAIGQGTGQLVICSSQPDEQSWESRRYKNGVFTKQLLDTIKNSDSDGLIETFNNVQKQVSTEVKQDRLGARQTPVLNSKWEGNDLILAAKPTVSQEVPQTVLKQLGHDSSERLSSYIMTDPDDQKVAFNNILKPPIVDESQPDNSNTPDKLLLNKEYFEKLLDQGDPKQLLRDYRSAVKNNPTDPDMPYRKGLLNIHFKRWIAALNDFSDALMKDPNCARYYIGRAYVQFKRKKIASAHKDYEFACTYDKSLPKHVHFE